MMEKETQQRTTSPVDSRTSSLEEANQCIQGDFKFISDDRHFLRYAETFTVEGVETEEEAIRAREKFIAHAKELHKANLESGAVTSLNAETIRLVITPAMEFMNRTIARSSLSTFPIYSMMDRRLTENQVTGAFDPWTGILFLSDNKQSTVVHELAHRAGGKKINREGILIQHGLGKSIEGRVGYKVLEELVAGNYESIFLARFGGQVKIIDAFHELRISEKPSASELEMLAIMLELHHPNVARVFPLEHTERQRFLSEAKERGDISFLQYPAPFVEILGTIINDIPQGSSPNGGIVGLGIHWARTIFPENQGAFLPFLFQKHIEGDTDSVVKLLTDTYGSGLGYCLKYISVKNMGYTNSDLLALQLYTQAHEHPSKDLGEKLKMRIADNVRMQRERAGLPTT